MCYPQTIYERLILVRYLLLISLHYNRNIGFRLKERVFPIKISKIFILVIWKKKSIVAITMDSLN